MRRGGSVEATRADGAAAERSAGALWWGDREESAAHGACGLVAAHQPAEHQGGGSEGGEAAGGDEVAARMEIRRRWRSGASGLWVGWVRAAAAWRGQVGSDGEQ